jgi:hypothetical protein
MQEKMRKMLLMFIRLPMLTIILAAILALNSVALADDNDRYRDNKHWREGEWKEEFWDGPCEVKIESKRGEFKREIKCKDGIGAWWDGEWKKEFWDGPCRRSPMSSRKR